MSSMSQPIQNVMLQAADHDGSLLPGLVTWIDVHPGDTLVERGVAPADVFFPESAVLSFVCELGDGKFLEVASVGRHGSTAALTMLGGTSAVCSIVVSVPGRVGRVSMVDCMREIGVSPAFAAAAAANARQVFQQTQQSTVCAAFHSVEARLATWLLVTSERAGGGRIVAAHHTIARMLGIRRASVSDVATRLRSQGFIDYVRNSFRVLDAAELRAVACCCHAQLVCAAEAIRPSRTTPLAPLTRAQLGDVRQRSAAAREAMELAVRHCGTFIRHSIYRISKSGVALDESERVVQHLRAAVQFYIRALHADNKSVEAAITMVTEVVDEVEAPVSDKGMLRAAAAQWAMDALDNAPSQRTLRLA
jgi:CRP-like cAMP-binding protein